MIVKINIPKKDSKTAIGTPKCCVENCNNNGRNIVNGLRYCDKHKYHIIKFGYIKETIYDKNEIIIHEDYAVVVVKDKYNNIKATTKIDIDDIPKVQKGKIGMYPNGHFYINFGKRDRQRLTRYLLNISDVYTPGGKQVDHINRDPSDNRKCNLRYVECIENQRNKENSVSIHYCTHRNIYYRPNRIKPYYYDIKHRKGRFVKHFNTEKEAYEAYIEKLKILDSNISIKIKL